MTQDQEPRPPRRPMLPRAAGVELVGIADEPVVRADEEQLKLAGFRVGSGLYGIDIMRIKEVIQSRPHPVRPVPHAPPLVEGVIALRGVVIPVVDLRKRFGAPIPTGPEVERLTKLVIVSVRGRIVGLKVDLIVGELRVPAGGLRPAPSILRPGGPSGPEFFSGVCRIDEQMVFVVNLEALIDPDIAPLEAAPETLAAALPPDSREGTDDE